MDNEDSTNTQVQWRHAPSGDWHYCPLCGGELTNRAFDGKDRRYCARCGFVYWERPLPAAAAIIVEPSDPDRIVLVKRRYAPQIGKWTLPGGGMEFGESVEEAATREVYEETGLSVEVTRLIGTWSTPNRETLITFYLAYPRGGRLKAGTDAEEVFWFSRDSLPPLAFSTHEQALKSYWKA